MNGRIEKINGLFAITDIITKDVIFLRTVIASLFLLISLLIAKSVMEGGSEWWVTGIFLFISFILIFYLVTLFKRKRGIHLIGFQLNEDLLQEGTLIADSPSIRKIVGDRKSGKLNKSQIIPVKWKAFLAKTSLENEKPLRAVVSISNQKRFQTDYLVDWHISKIELFKTDNLLYAGSMSPECDDLCIVSNNQSVFPFTDDGKNEGRRLLNQILLVGEKLIEFGAAGPEHVILKIIPAKSSFTRSAMFGAIGVAFASFRDESKKKKMRKELEEGKLTIINKEVDKELFDLIDKFNWEVTI